MALDMRRAGAVERNCRVAYGGSRFRRLYSLFVIVSVALGYSTATTATVAEEASTELRTSALRVFVDCDTRCDMTFLRREIHYINYVRDRQDAQVHVMITAERSGSGRQYTLSLFGLEEFAGIEQTLSFNSSNTETDDERRRDLARVLQIGLAPYVLQTPLGKGLEISYRAPQEGISLGALPGDDPWNFWVFQSELGIDVENEDRRDVEQIRASFNASRITEAWLLRLGLFNRDRERNFEFDDGSTLKNVSKSESYSASAIKSLGAHWGAGLGVRRQRSTFRNLDQGNRIAAAIEYNLYPYTQSSERQMKFGYFLGVTDLEYEEQTVFGLLSETRPDQGVYMEYDINQRWGEISVDLVASHYLDDTALYRISLEGDIDYRITRGLSVRLFARGSIVRDQIYLPGGGTSDEDVLLGRRALDTGFRTEAGVRIRYTFGSIYNNVVNNRLSGSEFTRIF